MPSPAWVQGRVQLMLKHTYTRVVREQVAVANDEWGNPVSQYTPTDEQPGVPCLFLDESDYILGAGGPIQVEENTLCVTPTDPLSVGDQVINVIDPVTAIIVHPGPSTVESFTDIASHGYVLYRYARLYAGEVV